MRKNFPLWGENKLLYISDLLSYKKKKRKLLACIFLGLFALNGQTVGPWCKWAALGQIKLQYGPNVSHNPAKQLHPNFESVCIRRDVILSWTKVSLWFLCKMSIIRKPTSICVSISVLSLYLFIVNVRWVSTAVFFIPPLRLFIHTSILTPRTILSLLLFPFRI